MAALDPRTLISQYGHTAWRAQDGFMTIQIDNNFEISVVRKRGIPQDSEPDLQGVSAAKNISAA